MPIAAQPGLTENPPTGCSSLFIEVENIGDTPAEEVDVALISNDPTMRGETEIGGIPVHLRGRAVTFVTDEKSPLEGGARRRFYLPAQYVDEVRGVFDIVSPDEIYVQVLAAAELAKVEGEVLSAFVEKL